jgi:uncharacterized paraquat-inducible protein A
MDEFDFVYDREEEDNEDWFCSDCNMGPIAEEKTKCPRCGFKHHGHWEKDVELDENGDPIDEKFYEEHY